MTQHIQAIFENGVLRPLEPLQLSEHQRVRLSISSVIDTDADGATRQKAAFAELDAELDKLPQSDQINPVDATDLDQSIYGRPA